MEAQAIYEKLLGHFGADVILTLQPVTEGIRDSFITIQSCKLFNVCQYCQQDPDLSFDFCQSISGMDTGETFTCVFHLYSYLHRHTLVLKTATPRSNPLLQSCVGIWPAANWYEREIYDLYGIVFEGHPDLRRLLLPEDWPGHPMRKDWQEPAFYLGMPTSRTNTLEQLEEAPE